MRKIFEFAIVGPVIFLMGFYPGSVSAQYREIEFRHIKSTDGLSQNTASCIFQDYQGFIWIATESGLNKYDGYTFNVYTPDPNDMKTLSNNYILTLCQDQSRVLWIGTKGGGLNKYIREKEQFLRYINDPTDSCSLSDNFVNCIYEDHSGVLWIGTERGGLNRFDRKNDRFIRYRASHDDTNSLSHNHVRSIYEDHRGVLWIGTDGGGLNIFDRQASSFFHYKHDPQNPHSLSSDRIYCIYEDRSGVLWIGTVEGGLNRFDRQTKRFYRYMNQPHNESSLSHNTVHAIYEDQSGNFWIGTNNGGLNIMDRETGRFVHYKHELNKPNCLSNDRIYSIFEDASGVLWFGTRGGGVNVFDPNKKKFIHYQRTKDSNSLSHNAVYAIHEDHRGILWIGTLLGLNRFDPVTKKFTHYFSDISNPNGLCNNSIWALCVDHLGYLWIGTNDGLDRYDPQNKNFIHYRADANNPNSLSHNSVWTIFEDRSGKLWIGTANGLNHFDPNTGRFTVYVHDPGNPESISHNNIWCILEDYLGNMWIGTEGGGLNCFNRDKKTFVNYVNDPANPNSLASNNVYAVYEDGSNILWIGTNGGLHRFDRKNERFIRFTEKDGLPNDVIYAILEDDQANLWMSTNHGIIKFNPVKREIKNFDIADGLQSNEFNFARCKRHNGEMLFGGINGFNIFNPAQIQNSPFIPPIVITNFKIFNRKVSIGELKDKRVILKKSITETEAIKLSYTDREFSFEFAALHFTSPEKNEYAYKMEGFEDEWNWVGNQRTASYMNLSPGVYTFQVKGSNGDGVWNEKGASIRIAITPPFWKTIWFRIITGICVIFLIAGVYEWRTFSYKKRNIELAEYVEKRTAELKTTMEELMVSNQKLKKTTNQLENVNKELKEFAYIVSHDLKAPLRGVTQIANWMSQDYMDVLDENGKEQLNLLTSRVKRMDALINGVLQYSRAGESIKKRQNISLHKLVREIIDSLASPKHIQVTIEKLPDIMGDPVKIQQVFQNLISNAVKYNDKKKGLITIGFKDDGDFWRFHVSDNGPGIDKKYHDKIFEIFQSLEARDKEESTGVGLSVVKKIINQFGGEVWLESQRGKGSKFYFTIKKERMKNGE